MRTYKRFGAFLLLTNSQNDFQRIGSSGELYVNQDSTKGLPAQMGGKHLVGR